ncbi:nucleotidyltransferase domain-containing protein [Mammaliicoccus sciuri]|uniref:nucleotidyltransferase domain-containing protein n=1 Tax=Mammaliicoccus sciuri TaxID=1296 RepID=UPI002DB58BAC|nr:nucleotidyltransferase domain-containing protein [Mammaliicoccus sciuri]MEB7408194.1 nucleotidyltransferase domain-containing protein [Mammaliicoccus sciuri]
MRYEIALEKIVPALKKVNGVLSIFLKGSIARGKNDAYSDLDIYVMLECDVQVEEVYDSIVDALEQYQTLLFKELVEIICPQIVGIFEDMLHIDCYIVHEHDYPQTDDIKVMYDPNGKLKEYDKKDLSITEEVFIDSALDSCWFIFQYDHIVGRGQYLWTTQMIDNALNHAIKVLLYKYYPEKAVLGKKAAHHLPADIYSKLNHINDCNNSIKHREAVAQYMNFYQDYIKDMVEEYWVEGFEKIYDYLYKKYA